MTDLTHFDANGRPAMVDVSEKASTARMAHARGRVTFNRDAYTIIRQRGVKKGDLNAVAMLAGIGGAKKTADLIPLCHPLPVTSAKVETSYNDELCAIDVDARIKTTGQTGVEMEALTAVSVACLTIYDMAKSIDKGMIIGPIELIAKTGGASGDFEKDAQ